MRKHWGSMRIKHIENVYLTCLRELSLSDDLGSDAKIKNLYLMLSHYKLISNNGRHCSKLGPTATKTLI